MYQCEGDRDIQYFGIISLVLIFSGHQGEERGFEAGIYFPILAAMRRFPKDKTIQIESCEYFYNMWILKKKKYQEAFLTVNIAREVSKAGAHFPTETMV
eukprot:Awhi_evm1s8803